jgi:hypothetical protein
MSQDLVLLLVFPIIALPGILIILEATKRLWSR